MMIGIDPVLFSNTPNHAYDLKVKVLDLRLFAFKFCFKVFNSSYFSDHMMIWFIFCMRIDIGPKLYSAMSHQKVCSEL